MSAKEAFEGAIVDGRRNEYSDVSFKLVNYPDAPRVSAGELRLLQIKPSRWYASPGVRVRLQSPELSSQDEERGAAAGALGSAQDRSGSLGVFGTVTRLVFGSAGGLENIICEVDNGAMADPHTPATTLDAHGHPGPAPLQG